MGHGLAPLYRAFIGFQFAGEDLEEGGVCQFVIANESDLIIVVDDEGDLIQHLHAAHGFGNVGDEEDILAGFAVGLEADEGIAAGGSGQLFDGELIQKFESPNLENFNIGALQMNALLYGIELYVKTENVDAYNTVISEYLK